MVSTPATSTTKATNTNINAMARAEAVGLKRFPGVGRMLKCGFGDLEDRGGDGQGTNVASWPLRGTGPSAAILLGKLGGDGAFVRDTNDVLSAAWVASPVGTVCNCCIGSSVDDGGKGAKGAKSPFSKGVEDVSSSTLYSVFGDTTGVVHWRDLHDDPNRRLDNWGVFGLVGCSIKSGTASRSDGLDATAAVQPSMRNKYCSKDLTRDWYLRLRSQSATKKSRVCTFGSKLFSKGTPLLHSEPALPRADHITAL